MKAESVIKFMKNNPQITVDQIIKHFEIPKRKSCIEYRVLGKLHREDGPAVECNNGDKHWYLNGKLHREDGPAIEWMGGDKEWWVNGKRHRTDGPAIDSKDYKYWCINDLLHREDGPAVEYSNGNKSYYLNGIRTDSNFRPLK